MKPTSMRSMRRTGLAVLLGALLVPVALTLVGPAGAQTSDATPMYTRASFAAASGEQVYTHICQDCHMAQGEGAIGAGEYPALARNPKLAAAPYVAMTVLNGSGGMPAFARLLSDKQVADVTVYVRTHFGNDFSEPLSADEVKALRQ